MSQLAMNLFSTGATNTIGAVSTQQYPSATLPQNPQANNITNPFVFSNLLNIFLFRPDLNLGATLQALESKSVLQILAEPNVLTTNGKQGSFLAGGEFPYPVVQGAGALQSVTIQFREFGVRLNFVPTITPGGNIRLQVAPEVSALDYTNGVTLNGFSVPGLTIRKVSTEVELQQGQSFVIGGLLDRSVTDAFEKVPFIGDIPILGRFFQSKSTTKQNSELLVIVTPEIVQPIPAGAPLPSPEYPKKFMDSAHATGAASPGASTPESSSTAPPAKSIPVETLIDDIRAKNPGGANAAPGNASGTAAGTGAANETPLAAPASPALPGR